MFALLSPLILSNVFMWQIDILFETRSRSSPATTRKSNFIIITPHTSLEDAMFKYQGLALWMKEMDPRRYNELQMVCRLSMDYAMMNL